MTSGYDPQTALPAEHLHVLGATEDFLDAAWNGTHRDFPDLKPEERVQMTCAKLIASAILLAALSLKEHK